MFLGFLLVVGCPTIFAQAPKAKQSDTTTPLHTLQPEYPVPYGKLSKEQIIEVLNRVRAYLEATTPARLVNRDTRQEVADLARVDSNTVIEQGDFRIISYEWGVVYAGMLLAGEATGDSQFTDYATRRLEFIARITPHYRDQMKARPQSPSPVRSVINPRALDDAGSMCAAMIKGQRAGIKADLRPLIDNYIQYISTREFRLPDGTLARNRPQPNTIWLDDLFMSVPALAQMGKLTGERRYFDDAVKQVRQFSERMFNKNEGLYMHGWVAGMDVHPDFHWARANGWALMAKVELLEVLPEDHPGRQAVLELLRAHIRGLAACQSGSGFWHQLLDRSDSYLETSSTAIFVYSIARAMNRGWVSPVVYGPMTQLGWNAVSTKVNAQGQVEGTCVGTGMAFDPAFYYYRPINVYAAHGYGPVLLAGAEMINLLATHQVEINDSSVQFLR
ncbi:MAG: glycoside hydrolase family 88 protein [Acidobacteria bacterium]|nr:MAG: glycoside hydrolase family 88 protein [Acidobacteriota bacterium]